MLKLSTYTIGTTGKPSQELANHIGESMAAISSEVEFIEKDAVKVTPGQDFALADGSDIGRDRLAAVIYQDAAGQLAIGYLRGSKAKLAEVGSFVRRYAESDDTLNAASATLVYQPPSEGKASGPSTLLAKLANMKGVSTVAAPRKGRAPVSARGIKW